MFKKQRNEQELGNTQGQRRKNRGSQRKSRNPQRQVAKEKFPTKDWVKDIKE